MAQEKKLRQSYAELNQQVAQLAAEVAQLRQAFSGNAQALSAVVSLLGEDSVTAELQRLQQERQERQAEQMEAGVKLLVEAGVLKPATETAADSLIVGTDTFPDGSTRRVQFEARAIPPDIAPKFLGKKPGETVENNGTTLTIVEVYTVDKVRAAEYQKEQQAKAAAQVDAQVEAAAPAVSAEVSEADQQAAAEAAGEPTDDTAPQA